MNKRIREFWEQASIRYSVYETLKPAAERKIIPDIFAELIVKECMNAVGDGPMERPAVQRIKAAFGVKYYEPIEKAFGVEE